MAKHVQLRDSKTGEPIYPITIGSDVAPITDEEIKAICDFDDVAGGNVIPVATSAALGCVKVGNGIDINEDGVITTSGVQMELLWENAKPDETFPAQTVEIDLSQYDFVGIVYHDYLNSGTDKLTAIKVGQNTSCQYFRHVQAATEAPYIFERTCDTKANGIVFGNTYMKITGTSTLYSDQNAALIPTKIYGIRRGSGAVTSNDALVDLGLGDIGKQYESLQTVSVPTGTLTTATSITVPAGSYVITGWAEFATYGNVTSYQIRLECEENSGYDRSYNSGGGGFTMTRLWTFTKENTVNLRVYHGAGSTQNIRVRLQLMRVR